MEAESLILKHTGLRQDSDVSRSDLRNELALLAATLRTEMAQQAAELRVELYRSATASTWQTYWTVLAQMAVMLGFLSLFTPLR